MTPCPTALFISGSLCRTACAEEIQRQAFLQELPGCEVPFKEAKIEFLEHSRNVARLRELPVMVPIYDIFQQNHTAYVISEWTEHITLAEYVERSGGRLEWNAARALFMPVLSGLSDLYQAGVRHLGLSPDNLIITQSGKMKLSGFLRAFR